MERKAWVLSAYAIHIVLMLVILFLGEPDASLVANALLLLDMVSLLILVANERWHATCGLAIGLIVVTAPFVILWLATPRTGISYLYGGILVLAGFILLIVELILGWRGYRFPAARQARRRDGRKRQDRKRQDKEQEGQAIEAITTTPQERYLATGGASVYHRVGCRSLDRANADELIHLSSKAEAEGLGLEPCTLCKP